MAEARLSDQVMLQRIRNRVIEQLETIASYEEQWKYQRDVPYINVPTEMICGWADDFVREGWRSWFLPPVFTPQEIEAVARYDEVFRSVVDGLPRHTPRLSELIGTEPWERLRKAATDSLAMFRRRGRLSEDGGMRSKGRRLKESGAEG